MAKKSKAFGAKTKPSSVPQKPNPFDLNFQRKKRNVIGSSKNNGTVVGTRKVAHEIRKNTIGKELKLLNKQNKIKDQRIGQHNPKLTSTQKAELRFVAQRKNLLKPKRNKFLLNDEDDTLDHLASGLTEAEKYQRGLGHEANEDEELDPELMAQASFGGGSLNGRDANGKRLNRREIIKQAIERSVQAKAIKQHDKAIQIEQWERLDEQFSELKSAGEISFGRVDIEKEEGDDEYMELYTKLGLDTRVPAKREWATDITRKAIEEEAVKEAERLEAQKETLFKSREKLTFPMAVEKISEICVKNSFDLVQSLIVCHDAAVYLESNRRYCPEIIGFLLNTLMIANSKKDTLLSIFPAGENFLYFDKKSTVKNISPLSINALKDESDMGDLNKDRMLDLQVIRIAIRLTRFFAQLYDNISEAYPIVFGQFKAELSQLPIDNYPKALAAEVTETLKVVDDLIQQHSSMKHLHKMASQRVKEIEMLEPRMEEHFNAQHPKHKRDDPQGTVKRLQKRVKKERREAIKQLRGDARFIAGEQAKSRHELDQERQQKTKRIMASLQTQESEFKKRKHGKKF